MKDKLTKIAIKFRTSYKCYKKHPRLILKEVKKIQQAKKENLQKSIFSEFFVFL